MAYRIPFLRLVASGTLYGIEQFSYSMSIIPDFPSDAEDDAPTEVPPAIVTAFEFFHNDAALMTEAVRLTTLKLNLIGTNGRYASDGNTVLHDFGTPGTGGSLQPDHPAQVALAVSLRTARSRGRAHAGRFYLPGPSTGSLSADGRISAARATQFAEAAAELLDGINAALPGWRVGVTSDIGEGAQQEVTHVAVGRTLDTIRSRRTSIPEGYPPAVALAP